MDHAGKLTLEPPVGNTGPLERAIGLTPRRGPAPNELSGHAKKSTIADAASDVDYSYDPATGLPTGTTYPQSEGSYRFAVTNEYADGLLKRVRRADQAQTVNREAKVDVLVRSS